MCTVEAPAMKTRLHPENLLHVSGTNAARRPLNPQSQRLHRARIFTGRGAAPVALGDTFARIGR